jgi:uncharacterized membrane protein YqjE
MRAEEPSVAELVSRLSEDVKTLVRDELALARIELVEKGKRAGIGAGLFGGAGLFAAYGLAVLIATLILVLALAWPAWVAALVVGVLLLAVAGVLALVGKKEVSQATPPMPTEAVESAKADVQAVKAAVEEGRRS